jgi:hypothetical protein
MVLAAVFAMTMASPVPAIAAEKLKTPNASRSLDFKAPGAGPLKDEHCGPGHVPCDGIFEKYCTKVLKGTMSGEQDWGGKTCWTPS